MFNKRKPASAGFQTVNKGARPFAADLYWYWTFRKKGRQPPFLWTYRRKLAAFSPSRGTFVQLRDEERGFKGALSRGIFKIQLILSTVLFRCIVPRLMIRWYKQIQICRVLVNLNFMEKTSEFSKNVNRYVTLCVWCFLAWCQNRGYHISLFWTISNQTMPTKCFVRIILNNIGLDDSPSFQNLPLRYSKPE